MKKLQGMVMVCVFMLTACSMRAAPSATPKPSSMPVPTSTLTPTPQPTLALGERQKVDAGGYSIQVPVGFETEFRNTTQAAIRNTSGSIVVIMQTTQRKSTAETVETMLNSFLTSLKTNTIKDLKTGDPYSIKVRNLDGLAVNINGTVFNRKNTGQIIVADAGQAGFFVAFGFAADTVKEKLWDTEGHQLFDAIMNSVEFFTPVVKAGSCLIASDKTYGYSQENPIKVGGGDFDGPPRERAFLDNLAGPKGEKISYTRAGSLNVGDTILDQFIITGLDKEITIYVDEYTFTEPQAPFGFTCLTAFPLEKP